MIASGGRGLRATTAWAQPMAVPFFSHAAAVIDSGPAGDRAIGSPFIDQATLPRGTDK